MADPWSSDLAALGEQTRNGLRSIDATRAALSTPKETHMKIRFIKTHPALAALIALAFLAVAAPIAYAVVREVWVSIDPTKPASEIENDIQSQLQAAGMPATVHADKSDGRLRVAIKSHDPSAQSDVHISVAGGEPANAHKLDFRLEVRCNLDTDQEQLLDATAASAEMHDALEHDFASDADRATAIKAAFEAHGFHDVDIQVDGGSIQATVKSPPTS